MTGWGENPEFFYPNCSPQEEESNMSQTQSCGEDPDWPQDGSGSNLTSTVDWLYDLRQATSPCFSHPQNRDGASLLDGGLGDVRTCPSCFLSPCTDRLGDFGQTTWHLRRSCFCSCLKGHLLWMEVGVVLNSPRKMLEDYIKFSYARKCCRNSKALYRCVILVY